MGLEWPSRDAQIDGLRREVQRQAAYIKQLEAQLRSSGGTLPDQSYISNYGLSDKEMSLLRTGKKIAAIRAYRKRTGAGIIAAKEAIEGVPWY